RQDSADTFFRCRHCLNYWKIRQVFESVPTVPTLFTEFFMEKTHQVVLSSRCFCSLRDRVVPFSVCSTVIDINANGSQLRRDAARFTPQFVSRLRPSIFFLWVFAFIRQDRI